VLAPPAVWAARRWSPGRTRWVGAALAALGLAGLGALALQEALTWLSAAPPEWRGYYGRRVAYRLVMLTDVPLVQFLAIGLACWLAGRPRGGRRE
jgi:hypothetical protein